jgi:hypothetical protein
VVLALVFALALAAPAIAPGPVETGPAESRAFGLRFAALPNISYGSDVGVSLGAFGLFYRPSGAGARQERLAVGFNYTTRGPRTLSLKWDQPRLGDGDWGGLFDLRLADDRHEPYWGEGGALASSLQQVGPVAFPYRFHDRRIFLSVTARPFEATRPALYGRARLLAIDVRDQGPLLAAQRPLGSRGGSSLLWEVGVLLDTRDREVGTRKGLFANASAFAAPAFGPLGPGSFAGFDLAASSYWPLAKCATLAARALLDVKLGLGSVPFYERDQYEGITYGDGLGGSGTLRGVARGRMAGDQKGLASVELRLNACEGRPFGSRLLRMGVAAGVDAGFAHQQGYRTLGAVGVFAGLRALWDDAVLVRAEVGYAGKGPAFYLVTGEQF